MPSTWIGWFLVAFFLSFVLSRVVAELARKIGLVDHPKEQSKNIHKEATPLFGGVAIYIAVAVPVLCLVLFTDALTGGEVTPTHYYGFLLGGLVLMIGGYLDDRYDLPPKLTIVSPVLAALIAVFAGIGVEKLTNPLGGVIEVPELASNFFTFAWLMAVMYTTKFLDGLDGLSTGITGIGSLMIMFLALTTAYFQPDVALLAFVAFGACMGFLLWNFHPAAIFLGEGGSTFVGYLLGTMAVISGGKVGTAVLVLGIPAMDVAWAIMRRVRQGGFREIVRGDRKHLHHRLLDLGWSQRTIVWLYYSIAASFGLIALFLQSKQKLIALGVLAVMMLSGAFFLVVREKKSSHL